ncbi:unnamed protein product [Arctia plantaginis]|uniref:Peptidase S1 domain-containing protein n=1 Tax=Arctia plantaginis TaxID=874455 RepID=A0A8S0ZD51_ARCPL|nr:unnamed protein product [Arctia plantaginis]
MRVITLLAVCIAAVAANPQTFQPPARIVGGLVTTINQWPSQANIMVQSGNFFSQFCGGTIINNRSVLSAAHCVLTHQHNFPAHWLRLRLGSTWASSGVIAGSNYHLPDQQAVWVTGWGLTSVNGVGSEQLRQRNTTCVSSLFWPFVSRLLAPPQKPLNHLRGS